MAKKNKNNNKLTGKYVIRRLFLVVSLIVLIGAGFIYIGYSMAAPDQTTSSEPDNTSSSEPVSNVSKPDVEPVVVSESDPEQNPDETEPSPVIDAHLNDWNLILVNKENLLPDDFSVELETIVDSFKVDARIRESLLRMLARAREDGIILQICSAYRDPEYQAVLFENQVNEQVNTGLSREQAVIAAATVVAKPGTSEHHTGLAVDIVTPDYQGLDEGFATTPAFAWLQENAADYGFIMRFPKDKEDITNIIYEPWHYRYVSVDIAKDINEKSMCLEEYIETIKNPVIPEDEESETSED